MIKIAVRIVRIAIVVGTAVTEQLMAVGRRRLVKIVAAGRLK